MILTMQDVLALRQSGKADLLSAQSLVRVVPVLANPFRQYCKLKGIKGKGKKKFRKARKELASAKLALVDERTAGGLIRDSANR